MGVETFLSQRSYVDLDYAYGTLSQANGEYPVDYPAIRDNPMEFYVVATEARTGRPKYFTDVYKRQMTSCCGTAPAIR